MERSNAVLDLEYVFQARQFAYDVLRRFFIEEPSRDYLKKFVEESLIDLFPFIEDSQEIKAGTEEVKEYFSNFDVVNNDEHYEDLHWDYTRMFIGPFELPAPPWESVYVRKDGLLFQENTMAIRNLYQNFGYEIKDINLEAEDHVGLELDFMFHLNKLCLDACQKNNFSARSNVIYLAEEQSQFLENHLLAFIPQFTQKVVNNAQTQFYSGMSKLLRSYLKIDSIILEELLDMEQVN